jgi:hypothetical protein
LIDFKAEGAVIAEVWGIRSVKSNPEPVKGSDNKSKMVVARPKKVSAVGGKGLAKKNNQIAAKATRSPEKPTTASPKRGKSLRSPKIRKEDFSFSVTPEFRKKFKKAAKDAGHKKAEFLQILLASWQDRGPSKAEVKA